MDQPPGVSGNSIFYECCRRCVTVLISGWHAGNRRVRWVHRHRQDALKGQRMPLIIEQKQNCPRIRRTVPCIDVLQIDTAVPVPGYLSNRKASGTQV